MNAEEKLKCFMIKLVCLVTTVIKCKCDSLSLYDVVAYTSIIRVDTESLQEIVKRCFIE